MNDQNSTFDNEMRLRRYGRCYDCKQPKTGGSLWHYWCQTYYSKYFRDDFNSWTSGNELIDKFIQKKQLDALKYHDVIEWIPFDSLKDVGPLNDDEQSEPFFKATWIDGHIEKWKILNGSRINLNFLKLKSMIEASMYYEVVEWIPFDRFNDLQVFEGESGNTLIATWIDGPIRNWNYENNKWERFLADELFCLRSIGENISDFSELFQDEFKNWTSGNETIDKFIQNKQIIALNGFDVIRWFFFDRFKDIELIEGEFGTALNAHVPDWNFIPGDLDNIFDDGGNGNDNESVDEKEWAEMTEDWVTETHLLNVNLKRFNSSNISNEFLQEVINIVYGITKDPEKDDYMIVGEYSEKKICYKCLLPNTGWHWCNKCNSKHFQDEFKNWTSGNELIDELIKNKQLEASSYVETTWIDGYIYRWDYKENKWVRFNSIEDCLKRLDNSHTISQEFLQEVNTQLNAQRYGNTIRIHGVTKDPEHDDYMIIMDYAKRRKSQGDVK
ncbi:kinase-like domain-containing protein [Rhizophagus clarus]|uniref:Kinase-like domain-containing protein n=1 Tax=Rhizophagus clarus TaxID=94130 RepID=A0A8H3L6I6_9GLOM|nr:kinase-like domain-containing protein [Rhizophagus clarus]